MYAQAEVEMKAAALEAENAKRKQAEEAAAAAAAKKQEEHMMMLTKLQQNLSRCEINFSGAVAKANGLAECNHKIAEYERRSVAVHPRIRPFFGPYNLEYVMGPLILLFCIIFWLIGCFVGNAKITPMINPSAGTNGVVISEVIIRPGNEVCVIKNRSFNDAVRI